MLVIKMAADYMSGQAFKGEILNAWVEVKGMVDVFS